MVLCDIPNHHKCMINNAENNTVNHLVNEDVFSILLNIFYSFQWNVGSCTLLNPQQHSLYHKSKYKGKKNRGLQPMTQSPLVSSSNFLEGPIFCTNSTAKIYVKKYKINFTVTFLVSILGFQKSLFF